MKFITFYRLFYRHRFLKASIFLKIYLIIILPIRYFFNIFYLQKKINLDVYQKKFEHLYDYDLDKLFEYFNSDKGEYFLNQYVQPIKKNLNKIKGHGYSKLYEKIFLNLKEKSIEVLELGSFYGNASAALFFYFKNAKIFSGDINPDMFRYSSERVKNFYVDTGSRDSINNNIVNNKMSYDFIIEDASHMLKDQIISLFILFPLIKSGGFFIVEELDFPETREDMRINQDPPNLKQILLNVISNKDFQSKYISDDEKKYFLNNFASVQIEKGNFHQIAIIKKK